MKEDKMTVEEFCNEYKGIKIICADGEIEVTDNEIKVVCRTRNLQ